VKDLRPGPRSLELVAPGDLPRAVGNPEPLEGVGRFIAVIPEEAADVVAIERALAHARVAYSLAHEGGWVAITIGDRMGDPRRWTWDNELELLLALTAWVPENGAPVHRTRIQDRVVRGRLTGALLGCARAFDLRWVPAYLPVEARISLADPAGAFTSVVAIRNTVGEAIELVVEEATAAVVDLTYLRLRRIEN
jgi:hypothetical protein